MGAITECRGARSVRLKALHRNYGNEEKICTIVRCDDLMELKTYLRCKRRGDFGCGWETTFVGVMSMGWRVVEVMGVGEGELKE